MRLKDKVAIVTGAAHGMGEAEARLFAKEGARVVVADILRDQAEAVAADIRAGGGDAIAATMSAPIAHFRGGKTITGVVRSEWTVSTPASTQNILAESQLEHTGLCERHDPHRWAANPPR
jgi:NAD(P)-dependent dehydrogenase (short-subunit alcohol dehydrogenase family)